MRVSPNTGLTPVASDYGIPRHKFQHSSWWVQSSLRLFRSYGTDLFVGGHPQSNRCIFLGGCGHSGTTLLAARLGCHDLIDVIPFETRAFRPDVPLHIAKHFFEEHIKTMDPSVYLLEKTPRNVLTIDRILRAFPESKIILTVRNPLDSIASLKERYGSFEYAKQRWSYDNKILLKHISNIHAIIDYNSLTTNPEFSLRRLLKAINLPVVDTVWKGVSDTFELGTQNGLMGERRKQVGAHILTGIRSAHETLSYAEIRDVENSCNETWGKISEIL